MRWREIGSMRTDPKILGGEESVRIFEIRTAYGFTFWEISNIFHLGKIRLFWAAERKEKQMAKSAQFFLSLSPTTRQRFPRPLSPENPVNSFRGTHNKQRAHCASFHQRTKIELSICTGTLSITVRRSVDFCDKKAPFQFGRMVGFWAWIYVPRKRAQSHSLSSSFPELSELWDLESPLLHMNGAHYLSHEPHFLGRKRAGWGHTGSRKSVNTLTAYLLMKCTMFKRKLNCLRGNKMQC